MSAECIDVEGILLSSVAYNNDSIDYRGGVARAAFPAVGQNSPVRTGGVIG